MQRFVITDPYFPRPEPRICFAGTRERPMYDPKDLERLAKMGSAKATALLESDQFKLSYPKIELFSSDMVLNVAKPSDISGIIHELSILGFKPSRNK